MAQIVEVCVRDAGNRPCLSPVDSKCSFVDLEELFFRVFRNVVDNRHSQR